jgi:hypothetical protein
MLVRCFGRRPFFHLSSFATMLYDAILTTLDLVWFKGKHLRFGLELHYASDPLSPQASFCILCGRNWYWNRDNCLADRDSGRII